MPNVVESQLLLQSILNSVGAGVIVADKTGKFLLYNPSAEKILGIGPSAIGPEDWSKLCGFFKEDGITPLLEQEFPLVRAINGESVDGLRVFVQNRSLPRGIWLSVNVRPLLDSDGVLQGGVIAFEDISLTKQLEIEAARSNSDLQQFASVAAHDLQEPLRIIVSFLNLLEKREAGKLDEKSSRYMNIVIDGAKRMQTLINDLLEYSRIQSRGATFKSVDLDKLMRAVVDDSAHLHRDVKFQIESLPKVLGDPSQLRQLFANLVNNAVKFHSPDRPPVVEIGVQGIDKLRHRVILYVKDNGIGIEPQYFERIFIIFQRLHDAQTYKGTGIGLAICKRIIQRHGGEIKVESTFGQGSTFLLDLPLEE